MKFSLGYSALLIAAGFISHQGTYVLLTVLGVWLMVGVYCAGVSEGKSK